MISLPSCDELFQRFFDPWYEEAARKRRPFKGTFPDILQHSSFVGLSQERASRLVPQMQQRVLEQIARMVAAAKGDMRTYLPVEGEIDIAWVDAFDRHAGRLEIQKLIAGANPKEFGNGYVINACEFGALLSHVLCAEQPRLVWRLDWPYWDSCLLDPKTGSAIPVFHWGIKKLSEYGVDDGYAAKTKACLQFLAEERKLGSN